MNQAFLVAFVLASTVSTSDTLCAQSRKTDSDTQSESIRHRLTNATVVDLSTDERLKGYVVRLCTPAQRAKHLSLLAEYRSELREFSKKIEALDQKRQEAHKRNVSADELNAITDERNQLQTQRPRSQVSVTADYFDVLRIGVDYMEIRKAENSDSTVLIPLQRICKIVVPIGSQSGKKGDEPKSR